MQAIVLKKVKSPKVISVKNLGRLKSDSVRIQVISAGLCGSDIQKIFSEIPPEMYLNTNILGHEISGTVHAVGTKVRNIQIGDHVVVNPIIACMKCKYCKTGAVQHCRKLQSVGKTIAGGFAEYCTVPSSNVYKINRSVSFDDASMTDIVAVALHAYHLAGSPVAKDILIIGDGPVALLTTQICARYSNRITLSGKNKLNCSIAIQCGANKILNAKESPGTDSYDAIFESVGRMQDGTINQAILSIKPKGKIVVIGVFEIGYMGQYIFRNLFYKEATLQGSNSYGTHQGNDEFKDAVRLIENKHVIPSLIITHAMHLSDINRALELVKTKGSSKVVKIVFKPQQK